LIKFEEVACFLSDLHKNDLVFRSDLSGLKVVGRAQLDNRMKRLRNPVKVYRLSGPKCTSHLTRDYDPIRVEAAAQRALQFNACSYRSMKAILSTGLDRQQDNGKQPALPGLLPHQNIRGPEYYQFNNEEKNCA